ncbi:MAG: hypothetical protein LBE22_03095 [Azoarcus sp.]|jgi:hypothetical protein|nr:hypothetical protein [Azoarcus sp.]
MSIFSPLPDNAPPGDHSRRRGTLCLLLALAATQVTVLLFLNLLPLWKKIVLLEGAVYVLAATLFGAVLAVIPVITALGWLLALWYGVESVFMPRKRRTPTIDIFIVGAGLIAWFLPALGFLGKTVKDLLTGQVHFAHPAKKYLLEVDPIAYWQGIGFQLFAAGLLAWLAWLYWRGKLRRKSGE